MKPTSLLLIATGAALLMQGCGHRQSEAKNNTTKDNTIKVKTVLASTETDNEPIEASGIVVSETEARLSFKTGGIISKIYAEEGQYVTQGQLLATLNLTEIKAQVAQAQEAFQKAERDLKRAQNLYKDSVATLEQVQNATTGYNVARQNLEIARFNLGYSEIRASTNGKIVRKLMNENELTAPGTPVFFMNATGAADWKLKVAVADKDWARLKTGNTATARLDAFPDDIFPATVSLLAQGADPASGLYDVELKLKPSTKNLAAGLFATAKITPSSGTPLIALPMDALIEGNGASAFVFVPDNGKAHKIQVKVATIKGAKVLIKEGLTNSQPVITGGSAYLSEGSPIEIVK